MQLCEEQQDLSCHQGQRTSNATCRSQKSLIFSSPDFAAEGAASPQEHWAERHRSSVPCLQTVPKALHVLARSPRDFQSLLKMQRQYGLPGQTSGLQHFGQAGARAQLAQTGLGNPRASTGTVLGMLPPQGQALAAAGTALAAERTESLEAEEMPSIPRLMLFHYRERCSRDACRAGWVSAGAGRMAGVPSG